MGPWPTALQGVKLKYVLRAAMGVCSVLQQDGLRREQALIGPAASKRGDPVSCAQTDSDTIMSSNIGECRGGQGCGTGFGMPRGAQRKASKTLDGLSPFDHGGAVVALTIQRLCVYVRHCKGLDSLAITRWNRCCPQRRRTRPREARREARTRRARRRVSCPPLMYGCQLEASDVNR